MAFLVTVIHAHAWLIGQKLGMMARITASAAIYQKVSMMHAYIVVDYIVELIKNFVT